MTLPINEIGDFRTGDVYSNYPLVTIGLLSYNYAAYIVDALNSIFGQSYPFIELVIIDDFSSDESASLISQWIERHDIKCVFIKNTVNLGITKVSNQIVRLANGKYLNLFASDDIMKPDKISLQVSCLESAGEEYGLCYSRVDRIDESGKLLPSSGENYKVKEGDVLVSYLLKEFFFVTPSHLIRTSVYSKVGLYDERVLIEDYNFFVRLLAVFKVKFCDYVSLLYRTRNFSVINNEVQKNGRERYSRDRIISNIQVFPLVKDIHAKEILLQKTLAYLNNLYKIGSKYYWKLFFFLLKNGFYLVCYKSAKYVMRYSVRSKKSKG